MYFIKKILVALTFILLSSLPHPKVYAGPGGPISNLLQLDNKCREEVNKDNSENFYRLGRYFSPIILKRGKVDIYPRDLSKQDSMFFLKNSSELISIPFNGFENVIEKNIQVLKSKGETNSEMIEMYGLLKDLLSLTKNPDGLINYPCLSLYFQKCYQSDDIDDLQCIKLQGVSLETKLRVLKNQGPGKSKEEMYINKFNILKDLQEYFGLFGQLDRWAFIPSTFEGPEEEKVFMEQKAGVMEKGMNLYKALSRMGNLPRGGLFYPKILSYFPDALENCLNPTEKPSINEYRESEFYKNECWKGEYVHPIQLIKQLYSLLETNKISIENIRLLNGSFYFHGSTSRFFSYALFGNFIKGNDFLIKSRMKLLGAKILLGEAGTTATQENAGWISASTLTGFHKAITYSGVYKLQDNSFFYGLTFPDRGLLSGLGFLKAPKSYDELLIERKDSEKSQIAGFSNPEQRFYFEENFPIAFGFTIPKSYLVSKKAVPLLNEVMWFGGIPVKLIRVLIVPKKYLHKVSSFFKSRGAFERIEIITFEELWKPVSQSYLSGKILKYKKENKPKRVREFEENEKLNLKFSK